MATESGSLFVDPVTGKVYWRDEDGVLRPRVLTNVAGEVEGREQVAGWFPLRPLYWCPHWKTLNENKCETCQSERGTQSAYYRAADVDERLASNG